MPRAGGDEGVKSLDCFLVAKPKAGFVAGHAIDFRASIAPSDTEEHVSYMTLVAGPVIGWVKFVKKITGGIGEGVLLKSELTVKVKESCFGAYQVLEADFAEGDFVDGGFFERRLGEVMVEVTSDSVGYLLRGFGVVVQGDIGGAEAVLEGIWEERVLPSGDLGPVLCWALRRLASRCLCVDIRAPDAERFSACYDESMARAGSPG